MSASIKEADVTTLSSISIDKAFHQLESHHHGLTGEVSATRLVECGKNILSTKKPPTRWVIAIRAFCGWFNILLLVVAIMSVITQPPDWSSFTIVMIVILLASCIQFFQDCAGKAAAIKLQAADLTAVRVRRFGSPESYEDVLIDHENLAPGDVLYVDAGDTITADCIVIEASDLSIGQSGLTGESEPQRKSSFRVADSCSDILEMENVLWMGTNVVSGHGRALVVKTGDGKKSIKPQGPAKAYYVQIRILLA